MIAHWIYLTAIGLAVALRYLVPAPQQSSATTEALNILCPLLALVAIADYVASLFIERARRKRNLPGQVFAIPFVTAAFGAFIAIYGIVVWFLGASAGWFWFFIILALVHWFHSAVRWGNLPSA